MTTSRWLASGIVAGVIVLVVIAWARRDAERTPLATASAPAPPVDPPRAATATAASEAKKPVPPAPADLWLPSHAVRDHLPAADTGDAEALTRVGRALRMCVKYLADPEADAVQQEYERGLDYFRTRAGASNPHALENIERRYATGMAMHADCHALGAERVAAGLGYLERAARAGHAPAQVEYARTAFAEFPDANALLANLDEVIRRRDLARAFALQALDAGERGAILLLAEAYHGQSPLFPRNLQRAAPFSMAQEMLAARTNRPDEFRRLYEQGPPRERYGWGEDNGWVRDEAAWQAALARARELVDRIPAPAATDRNKQR